MNISKKLIQTVSQDLDLLEEFVTLFNQVQDTQDDVDTIVYDFFCNYNNTYRDMNDEYEKAVIIFDIAERLYNDFLLKVKKKYGSLNDK